MYKLLPILLFCLTLPACSGEAPTDLGVHDGHLAPCPNKPNCVSSQSQDKQHFVEPLHFSGRLQKAQEQLAKVIQGMEGAKIVDTGTDYMRAEFTSKHMKFVDDVEFVFDSVAGVIHVRSASRVGYSDMGVNRKRVEAIRKAFGGPQT